MADGTGSPQQEVFNTEFSVSGAAAVVAAGNSVKDILTGAIQLAQNPLVGGIIGTRMSGLFQHATKYLIEAQKAKAGRMTGGAFDLSTLWRLEDIAGNLTSFKGQAFFAALGFTASTFAWIAKTREELEDLYSDMIKFQGRGERFNIEQFIEANSKAFKSMGEEGQRSFVETYESMAPLLRGMDSMEKRLDIIQRVSAMSMFISPGASREVSDMVMRLGLAPEKAASSYLKLGKAAQTAELPFDAMYQLTVSNAAAFRDWGISLEDSMSFFSYFIGAIQRGEITFEDLSELMSKITQMAVTPQGRETRFMQADLLAKAWRDLPQSVRTSLDDVSKEIYKGKLFKDLTILQQQFVLTNLFKKSPEEYVNALKFLGENITKYMNVPLELTDIVLQKIGLDLNELTNLTKGTKLTPDNKYTDKDVQAMKLLVAEQDKLIQNYEESAKKELQKKGKWWDIARYPTLGAQKMVATNMEWNTGVRNQLANLLTLKGTGELTPDLISQRLENMRPSLQKKVIMPNHMMDIETGLMPSMALRGDEAGKLYRELLQQRGLPTDQLDKALSQAGTDVVKQLEAIRQDLLNNAAKPPQVNVNVKIGNEDITNMVRTEIKYQ